MANIKFTQLPNQGALTDATIVPSVASGTNYTVTAANIKTYVNSTTGNITGGNILTSGQVSATGNVQGNYILGNGSQLTGLPATYGNSNVTTLLAGFGSNTVSTTGNVTAGYFVGNGSLLTGLPANYGNSNVATLLAGFGSNAISTTGNVTAGYFTGNGSLLSSITGANVTGNVANATHSFTTDIATTSNYATSAGSATTATTAGTVTTNSQPNITSVGTLTTLSVTGNVTSGANIAGSYFIGNGSQLTGIVATSTYGNANVAAYLPTYTGNIGAGNLTASGNVQGNYIKGNGALMTGVVTSIVAGTGISVNVSTGAVTITNTGGGTGNSSVISNANAFANTAVTGNSVLIYNGNVSYGSSGLSVSANSINLINYTLGGGNTCGITLANDGNINISPASNAGKVVYIGGSLQLSLGGANTTVIGPNSMSTPQIIISKNLDTTNGTGVGLQVPVATAAVTRTYTGAIGSIRSVTDSPTTLGRMCYWSTTGTAGWRYIDTNTAV